MNAITLLQHFEEISEAPDAVARLRRFVLDLAVRGKLVAQDPGDEPVRELLGRIREMRSHLVRTGVIRKEEEYEEVGRAELPIKRPESWQVARMGWLAQKLGAGSTPRGGKSVYQTQGVPFLRSQNVHNHGLRLDDVARIPRTIHERMSGTHIQRQDILLNITGASIGRSALIPCDFDEGNVSQHVSIIRLVDPEIREIVHLWLISPVYQQLIMDVQVGVSREGLSMQRLKRFPMVIPPLPEQHRIVAKVDALMALCDELDGAQATREKRRDRLVAATLHRLNNGDTESESGPTFKQTASFYFNHLPRLTTKPEHIQQLRQTILNLAVRGKLVEQDPEDEPAVNLVRRAEIQKSQLTKKGAIKKHFAGQPIDALETRFKIPSSWCWARLGSLCQLVASGSRGWAKYYSGDGAIFVRMGNLSRGTYKLRMSDVQHVRVPAGGEGTRTRLKENDILISITGEVGLLGLIPPNFGEAYINQHTCLVRLLPVVWSRYFPDLLRSPFAKEHFDAPQRGIKNSYRLSDVSNLPVPLPPLAEQRRIVAKVDELMTLCDELETDLANAVTNHHQLLESVLRQALQRGENAATARPVV